MGQVQQTLLKLAMMAQMTELGVPLDAKELLLVIHALEHHLEYSLVQAYAEMG